MDWLVNNYNLNKSLNYRIIMSTENELTNIKKITFDLPEPKVITFECDEVVVKGKSLETKWISGVPLNFEEYDTLVFSGNGKTYTYKKV